MNKKSNFKILISGDFAYYSRNNDFLKAFRDLKIDYEIFDDQDKYDHIFPFKKHSLIKRITHRLTWKYFASRVGKDLIKKIKENNYDVIFILKGWFYSPKTIKKIKEILPNSKLICFNPDNPFNTWHHGVSNDWIRKSIPYYDIYFIWGKFLIDKLYKAGAKKVELLPFWYNPEIHYFLDLKDENEKKYYGSDIAFIGTYDEERAWWLNQIKDYNLKIWGNGWWKANKDLQKKWMKKPAYGEEFNKICSSSKIVLNIIRKQNIPSHNMRTFESPACKAFVLSTRTNEVKEFFEEDKEIVLFSNPEELRQKIDFYLKNDKLREKIRESGYARLINSNYSYLGRFKKILEIL
ncbi:MAG: glycosyltransferase [Candidatus Goldbacteria bacterium]|nr:glycosyltransferase [Candidatus Goldiibacteriota bacterium]